MANSLISPSRRRNRCVSSTPPAREVALHEGPDPIAHRSMTREAALAAVLITDGAVSADVSRAGAAVTLRAAPAADPAGLTPGESTLLGELLDRLAAETEPAR
jgi:hypothetical protein